MRIRGTFTADLIKFLIKSNESNDGREAQVDVDIALQEDDAKAAIGEDFATLALGTAVDRIPEDGNVAELVHLQDKQKPSKKRFGAFELHKIEIAGERIEVQPELLHVSGIEGQRAMVARFRIPIPVDKMKPLKALLDKVGKKISVEFDPKQETLALEGDSAGFDGAGDGAPAH